MMEKIYNPEDLRYKTDKEILSLLKESWGYDTKEPLLIIGMVNLRKAAKNIFYVLENLKDKNWQNISYPLNKVDIYHTCFIGEKPKDIEVGDIVKLEAELTKTIEREKHGNPFELKAKWNTITKLIKLPDHVIEQSVNNNNIEAWIIDYIAKSNSNVIEYRITRKEKELEEIIQKNEIETRKITELTEKKENIENEIEKQRATIQAEEESFKIISDQWNERISRLMTQHYSTEEQFDKERDERQKILDTLNSFIERKAETLKELGILDEITLNKITGNTKKEVQQEDVYSLQDLGDIEQVIAHVQAYLHNKGIMYRRNVLENFYTLLSARDLIILAGDSGSGKTNLVKSFADAIGGKSYIIPVKPNWTSAEDLLGYYNPIEQSYLATPFLEALLEASTNPDVPHIICLDEMNLARVEYYFADFLSLLEERDKTPIIPLYSKTESSHLVSEARNFLALVDEAIRLEGKEPLSNFTDILKDQKLNQKLHELCGFKDGDSLLKYHTRLRKTFDSYVNNPSEITLPSNVFFVGAINVDETTHYLSPKILDRAHIIRFTNPLLQNWDEIEEQVIEYKETSKADIKRKVALDTNDFCIRQAYPKFDINDELTSILVEITKEYLVKLGVEFGLRTIRQAKNYADLFLDYFPDTDDKEILDNIIRQKILPKLMLDGETKVNGVPKKDILTGMKNYLSEQIKGIKVNDQGNSIDELAQTINSAENNNWVVNYWTR